MERQEDLYRSGSKTILTSILSREQFPQQIFNYRNSRTTIYNIKAETMTLPDAMEMPEMKKL